MPRPGVLRTWVASSDGDTGLVRAQWPVSFVRGHTVFRLYVATATEAADARSRAGGVGVAHSLSTSMSGQGASGGSKKRRKRGGGGGKAKPGQDGASGASPASASGSGAGKDLDTRFYASMGASPDGVDADPLRVSAAFHAQDRGEALRESDALWRFLASAPQCDATDATMVAS